MRSAGSLLQRHPAASYFALTFAISWGAVVAIAGPSHIVGTKEEFERLFPIVLPFFVLGPSASGIALTGLVGGESALRDYRSRLFAWRVDARFYAAALLTAPLYFAAVMFALSAFSREFLPGFLTVDDAFAYVLRGAVVALVAGIVEELGWTGFAVPTLRQRHGPLATGLIVGAMWGLWHVLPKIWGAAAHGIHGASLAIDLACAVIGLTGFRILMVWVYDRTESLLIGILMHMGLTASTLILQPNITGAPLTTISIATTVAVWVLVAAVALLAHGRPSATHKRRRSWSSPQPRYGGTRA